MDLVMMVLESIYNHTAKRFHFSFFPALGFFNFGKEQVEAKGEIKRSRWVNH